MIANNILNKVDKSRIRSSSINALKLLFIFLALLVTSSCSAIKAKSSSAVISKPKVKILIPSKIDSNQLNSSNAQKKTDGLWDNRYLKQNSIRPKEARYKKIQLRDHPNVRKHLAIYSGKLKKFVSDGLSRRAKYKVRIQNELISQGLSPEFINIAHIESRFITDARSKSGAVGMWQFMPATARAYGLKVGMFSDDRKNAIKSTRAAVRYLKDLNSAFSDPLLAIAAYNAGEWGVKRAMKKCRTNDFFKLETCSGLKSGLKKETIDFVSKFIALTLITRRMERYGF